MVEPEQIGLGTMLECLKIADQMERFARSLKKIGSNRAMSGPPSLEAMEALPPGTKFSEVAETEATAGGFLPVGLVLDESVPAVRCCAARLEQVRRKWLGTEAQP